MTLRSPSISSHSSSSAAFTKKQKLALMLKYAPVLLFPRHGALEQKMTKPSCDHF